MMLYINGSDIHRIVIGAVNDDRSAFEVSPVTIQANPEHFLREIHGFIEAHPEKITGIVAILGPGSATALRTSLTIVNTLAFAWHIPIFGVEFPFGSDDRASLVLLHDSDPMPMARPMYGYDARITLSKKDALGRR